jgi:hypothetical protein
MAKTNNATSGTNNGNNNNNNKKALTEEELKERKRKREETQKGHNALFARHVKSSKQNKDETIGDFMKQSIALEASLSNMDRKSKPTDDRFQKFIELAKEAGAQLVLPTDNDLELIDTLRSKLRIFKATKSRPPTFWKEFAELNRQIESVEPELKSTIKLIGDAASCYHIATAMENLCVTNDDYTNGPLWHEVVQSLISLGNRLHGWIQLASYELSENLFLRRKEKTYLLHLLQR